MKCTCIIIMLQICARLVESCSESSGTVLWSYNYWSINFPTIRAGIQEEVYLLMEGEWFRCGHMSCICYPSSSSGQWDLAPYAFVCLHIFLGQLICFQRLATTACSSMCWISQPVLFHGGRFPEGTWRKWGQSIQLTTSTTAGSKRYFIVYEY